MALAKLASGMWISCALAVVTAIAAIKTSVKRKTVFFMIIFLARG